MSKIQPRQLSSWQSDRKILPKNSIIALRQIGNQIFKTGEPNNPLYLLVSCIRIANPYILSDVVSVNSFPWGKKPTDSEMAWSLFFLFR